MRATTTIALAVACGVLVPQHATAQRRKATPLIKAKLVETIEPQSGFVDDPFVFDGAGGRLAWINADAAELAEIRVVDLTQGGAQLFRVDISDVTTTPVSLEFVGAGDRFFVVSRKSEDHRAEAAVITKRGKVLRRFGPADDIRLTTRDGKRVVVLYSKEETRARGRRGKPGVRHSIELRRLDNGRRVGRKRVLQADRAGKVAKLDFEIAYFADDYLRVVGIKGGTWDRKEDQRSPDVEGHYDVVTGAFSRRVPIDDVLAHAHKLRRLAKHPNENRFLDVAKDLSRLELVTPDAVTAIKLAQPFHHYDPKSLRYHTTADGGLFFSLTIDPVNPDAVARKKADPRYLDLYEYSGSGSRATRRARLLLTGKRDYAWRATSEFWIVVPRLLGFDRGGKELRVYALE